MRLFVNIDDFIQCPNEVPDDLFIFVLELHEVYIKLLEGDILSGVMPLDFVLQGLDFIGEVFIGDFALEKVSDQVEETNWGDFSDKLVW